MSINTINIDELADKTDGNLYEAVVILSKRARQIAAKRQEDLSKELSYFEGFDVEKEDAFTQEEQARTSLKYEKMPKPTEVAINEMMDDEIYFRNPSEE